MSDKTYNKAVFNGKTYIDLSSDTVQADKVLYGYTFHDKSGAILTGSNTYDADTSSGTARASEILATKIAFVNGAQVIGSMNNRGAWTGVIDDKTDVITIPVGFHDGSGSVQLDSTESAKIIAGNIKSGVSILGVTGDYTGESISAQSKTVTPTFTEQTIIPDDEYDYLAQVVVSAISVTETLNSAGGYTVTIG